MRFELRSTRTEWIQEEVKKRRLDENVCLHFVVKASDRFAKFDPSDGYETYYVRGAAIELD